eukprot:480407-Prymnesium_polylepis.1
MASARAARPTALAAQTVPSPRVFVRAARVVVAEPPLSALPHDDPWMHNRRRRHLLDHPVGHVLHRTEEQVPVCLGDRLPQML